MFVITGATGNTGSVAAQTLLDAGKQVRVIVRNAAKAKDLAARRRGRRSGPCRRGRTDQSLPRRRRRDGYRHPT